MLSPVMLEAKLLRVMAAALLGPAAARLTPRKTAIAGITGGSRRLGSRHFIGD
jgi:hypothetical protein